MAWWRKIFQRDGASVRIDPREAHASARADDDLTASLEDAPRHRSGSQGISAASAQKNKGEGWSVAETLFAFPFRTADRERAHVRLTRGLMLLLTVSVIANLTLINVLTILTPLRRDIPYFLQVVEGAGLGGAFVQAGPLQANSSRLTVIAKTLAMEYVKIRHSMVPSVAQMNWRWGEKCLLNRRTADEGLCAYVSKHSSEDVYNAFREANLASATALIEAGVTRQIKIDVEPIELSLNQLEIRFTMIDSSGGEGGGEPRVLRTRRFIANLWYAFLPTQDARDDQYLNPTGFRVLQYHLAEAQNE